MITLKLHLTDVDLLIEALNIAINEQSDPDNEELYERVLTEIEFQTHKQRSQ